MFLNFHIILSHITFCFRFFYNNHTTNFLVTLIFKKIKFLAYFVVRFSFCMPFLVGKIGCLLFLDTSLVITYLIRLFYNNFWTIISLILILYHYSLSCFFPLYFSWPIKGRKKIITNNCTNIILLPYKMWKHHFQINNVKLWFMKLVVTVAFYFQKDDRIIFIFFLLHAAF